MPSDEEFVQLMARHQRRLWRFINTLLPAVGDADDVLQETSLVLWRKWDQYDHDRSFLAWACGIARLQVFRFVRQHRSQRLHLDERVLQEIADLAEQRVIAADQTEARLTALRTCMDKLGEKEREVVEARYFELRSTQQIADLKAKPLASIYTILRRARGQLLDCVNRNLSGAGVRQ
ncbi:MAG: sigma-70 family RNA polymerase sigma factor [Planctomycetota bacterium]